MLSAKTLLISFWPFLMAYSLLTTSDSFLPGNSAPQLKQTSHSWDHHHFQVEGGAPGTPYSLHGSILPQDLSLGRGLSCATVVVPAGAGYGIVVHHHPHYTGLSGDPGPPISVSSFFSSSYRTIFQAQLSRCLTLFDLQSVEDKRCRHFLIGKQPTEADC